MDIREINSFASRYFKDLISEQNHLKEKNLVILVGIPGSGKTTFSEMLNKKYPSIIISTDEIKKTLINERHDLSLIDLYKIRDKLLLFSMNEQMNIICDSNSDLKKYRIFLKKNANKFGYSTHTIFLDINLEESYKRVLKRKGLKKSNRIYRKIEKFINTIERPGEAIFIDAKKDLKSIEEYIKRIKLS